MPSDVIPDVEWRRREHANLRNALKLAEGRIYGPNGAAELLGVKPTTLISRLKALGLRDASASPEVARTLATGDSRVQTFGSRALGRFMTTRRDGSSPRRVSSSTVARSDADSCSGATTLESEPQIEWRVPWHVSKRC